MQGAPTGDGGRPGTAIGKIDINDFSTYVAAERLIAPKALNEGEVNDKRVKARVVAADATC